jgi:adenylyltransferase/sulfurtransferase
VSLDSTELVRYARHLSLREVGVAGQAKLKAAKVLIVGAGGLGSPAALYLAAAGVGTIGLVDFDRVDPSNLQRQILHGTSAIGRSKLESAAARLGDLNPGVKLEPIEARLSRANALDVLGRFDFTLDGSDNFPTRYLVNDASVMLGKPYVYGSIFRFEGQVSVFGARPGPCYRCLFAEPPPAGLVPSCADAGVLGVLPGVIGTLQATEAIKLILGAGEPLIGRLLLYDALGARFREVAVRRDPACIVCGDRPTQVGLIDYEQFCGEPAAEAAGTGRDAAQAAPREVAAQREAGDRIELLDVRDEWEWDLVRIAGSRHIPLDELEQRLGELDPSSRIVALCHHGARSALARDLLVAAGYRARSLTGGIDAWAVDVDPTLDRY